MLSYNDSLFTKSRTQAVAVCLSLKACFVTKVMVRVISDALSTRFVAGMVTKCAERSSCCTFRHPFSLPSMCVCPCAHACMRVCVCVDMRLSMTACVVWCIVLRSIIPTSISDKLKFCIALSRLRGYWVSCVKYDYRYRDWVKIWSDCVLWMSHRKSGLIVCCGCPIGIIMFNWMAGMIWWDRR